MFKAFVTLSALALAVFCAPPGWPTAEEAKAEMQASGISSQAANGILKIATDFASQKPAEGFIGQVDAYIKTQFPEDQTAYQAFVDKKKAEFEARIAERKAGSQ
ncbi:unnamed protein product [Caenorhabditis nigoni]